MGKIGQIARRIIAAAGESGDMDEYNKLRRERDETISQNRSRRMRSQPRLPVPPKPEPPMGYEIYVDGEWEGFSPQDDEDMAIAEGERHADGGKVTVKRRPRKAKRVSARVRVPSWARKLSVPEKHQLQIALDTVENPAKALLGGPSVEEAKEIIERFKLKSK